MNGGHYSIWMNMNIIINSECTASCGGFPNYIIELILSDREY